MKWGLHFLVMLTVMLQNLVAMQIEEGRVEIPDFGSMVYKKVSYRGAEKNIPLLCADMGFRDLREHFSALFSLARELSIIVYVPLACNKSECLHLAIPEKVLDPLLKHLDFTECWLLGCFEGAVQIGHYSIFESSFSRKKISRITRSEKVVEVEEWVRAIRSVLQRFGQKDGVEDLQYFFGHDQSLIVNQFFFCDYTASCFELLD